MRELRLFGHYLSWPLVVLSLFDVLAVGFLIYGVSIHLGRGAEGQLLILAALGAGTAFVTNAAVGLYHLQLRVRLPGIFSRAAVAFLLGLPVVGLAAALLALGWGEVVFVCGVGAMAWGILGLLHAVFFALADAGVLRRRVLILGDAETAGLARLRRRADRRGFEVVGYLSETEMRAISKRGEPLSAYARRLGVDEIVVAMQERRGTLPVVALMDCRLAGTSVIEFGAFLERESGKLPLPWLRPAFFVFDANRPGRVQESMKRAVDLVGALFLLLISLPVTLGTMLAIKREEGWRAPVFYRQVRVGKGGVAFELLKFRSMRLDAEADGKARWANRNDDRVTRVGGVIRKLRIDELPQLLNVLRGQMSLVGPRPERPAFVAELEQHIPYYAVRHRIKPGVTGWAQLLYPYGASRADAAEKLQFDLYYLKNRSIMLDLIILLQTVEVVLFGKGAR